MTRSACCFSAASMPAARLAWTCFWIVSTLALLAAPESAAGDDLPVVRVEEDWHVELGTPSPEDNSPQIVTVISPVSTLEREHSVFELNHVTYPDYFAGGMQLQCWRGDWLCGFGSSPKHQQLNTEDEVVTFTSTMALDDGALQFEILNGSSQTWSSFGGNGYLKVRYATTLDDLDEYSPNVSVAHSRVAFASHRVRKLVLVEVRYFSEEGLIAKDETPRIVHEYSPE